MASPSENPKFKLSYFNVKALAEPIRLLFAYGGVDYEDIRVSHEEWVVLKPSKIFLIVCPLYSFPLMNFNI